MIRLVFPSKVNEDDCLKYIEEHYQNNEFSISGGGGIEGFRTYDEWINSVIAHHHNNNIPQNRVPSTTFLAYDDEVLVGVIDIRHHLNEYLESYGGHIGYGVRPSKRKKGYATQILAKGLEYCKDELKLPRVLITCDESNIGSNKTILANKGILIDQLFDSNLKRYTNRYKIKL